MEFAELFAGSVAPRTSIDGLGSQARFMNITGMASDPYGNIYVLDAGDLNIRKVDATGLVTTLAGRLASHDCGGTRVQHVRTWKPARRIVISNRCRSGRKQPLHHDANGDRRRQRPAVAFRPVR